MPYKERKNGPIGRDRAKQYSDCINCLSHRSVPLTIKVERVEREMGKFEKKKTATGRCKECGYQSSISVMDEETYKIIRPLLEAEPVSILEKTFGHLPDPEIKLEDVHFTPEDIATLSDLDIDCSSTSIVQAETASTTSGEEPKKESGEADTSPKSTG